MLAARLPRVSEVSLPQVAERLVLLTGGNVVLSRRSTDRAERCFGCPGSLRIGEDVGNPFQAFRPSGVGGVSLPTIWESGEGERPDLDWGAGVSPASDEGENAVTSRGATCLTGGNVVVTRRFTLGRAQGREAQQAGTRLQDRAAAPSRP